MNTGVGDQALLSNGSGSGNTAVGASALFSNTESYNTAVGYQAMLSNISGDSNTAVGTVALQSNTTGGSNTATGVAALFANLTGDGNTADGEGALASNLDGIRNTAVGWLALQTNTSGSDNIAIGVQAGSALTTESQNIDIGNDGVAGENSTIRIGRFLQTKTFIAGIRGVTTGVNNAIPVLIDSAGQLGTMSSSRRFKKEIKPMDNASEAILALKPVTFHYKSDTTNTPQFGLIAEEVASVNPDLVVRDEKGQIYTVRYDAVSAMLLNEFLKEHWKVEKLEATVAEQQKSFQSKFVEQEKQIEALASSLQKVSAQIEATKPASQVVVNNQ